MYIILRFHLNLNRFSIRLIIRFDVAILQTQNRLSMDSVETFFEEPGVILIWVAVRVANDIGITNHIIMNDMNMTMAPEFDARPIHNEFTQIAVISEVDVIIVCIFRIKT